MPSPEGRETGFRRALLEWFDAHQRELPWRHVCDPYAVWVSEIMLQQTQVATVVDYFERWMERFPEVETLAKAPIDEVLELWSGLGYYRRARYLHRAAQEIVATFGGEIPSTVEELKSLPGVGPYTAGAVSSIAFGKVEPLVDGNVMRVLSRLYAIEGAPRKKPAKAQIWGRAGELVDPDRPGDFNQGLMELGSEICGPKKARCLICPVSDHCQARAQGRELDFPQSAKRVEQKPMRARAAVVHQGGDGGRRFLVHRRDDSGLMGGLWEFPSVESDGESFPRLAALQNVLEALETTPKVRRSVGTVQHIFSHRKLALRVHDIGVGSPMEVISGEEGGRWQWVEEAELRGLGTASLFDKIYKCWRSAVDGK